MAQDIVLFWIVLLGLYFYDNLFLVPPGKDCVRFSSSGKLRYKADRYLQILQRNLVVLNPLNPFDRLVITHRSIGPITSSHWRMSSRQVRTALAATNRLSWLGSIYLLIVGILALASFSLYFGVILLVLLIAHFCVWTVALWELVRYRKSLQLSRSRTIGLALEALLVPGYLINLGKRVWLRRALPITGFAVGLRQLKRMSQGDEKELYRAQLEQRLNDITFEQGLDDHMAAAACPNAEAGTASEADSSYAKQLSRDALRDWLRDTRTCLKTSATSTGL